MADKWYTAASGNWSTAANWNSGTLPTAGDDVYADGKTITIDINVNVATIRNTQRSGGTSGGTYLITAGGITVTCTAAQGTFSTGSGGLCTISATSGTITINAAILTSGTANHGFIVSGAGCNVDFNGNLTTTGASIALSITGASVVNITGNILGGTSSACCSISAAATVTVTGNITGAGGGNGAGIANTSVAATINIIGNVTAQTGAGISSAIASVVTVKGIVTSSNTTAAVSLSSTSVSFTFSGAAVNNNNVMAIYCPNIKMYNANSVQWTFQNEIGGNKILYSAGIALGNPAITNVRSGITYGASLELTGTMIVPSPSDVRISVPTDNTVGTGQLTAADFLAAISSSLDPIAVRLKNVSTVDTSGAQMASYNI